MFVRTLTGFLKGREFATKERRRRVLDRPALREDGKERTSFEHAEPLKNHLLDNYNNLRLHTVPSATSIQGTCWRDLRRLSRKKGNASSRRQGRKDDLKI